MKRLIAILLLLLLFAVPAWATRAGAGATLTAENTWTDPIDANGRDVMITVAGTFSATVTVQVQYESGPHSGAWYNTGDTYTSPGVHVLEIPETATLVRVGVAAGAYTSGSVVVRVSR